MRKKIKTPDPTRVIHTCAWCGKRIPDGTELFSLNAKVRPGVDLTKHEGGAIELTLLRPKRIVAAIVPTRDSGAKKAGNDLLFVVCSESCWRALKEVLDQQIAIPDHTTN